MRVIITGAAGFIGRKLAEPFAATAETSPATFEAVAGDIGDPDTIEALMAMVWTRCSTWPLW